MIILQAAGPSSPALADDTGSAPRPLMDVIRDNGSKPARFALTDGSTVVGTVVRIDGETLIIRRPSAGLRTLALGEIRALNIKTATGELLHGRLVARTDGAPGWLADGDGSTAVATGKTEQDADVETGGPLIRLDNRDTEGAEASGTEMTALDQTTTVTPSTARPAAAGPVTLEIAADGASEGEELAYVRLRLSEPAPQPILIIYTMIDGSAVAPGDYAHRQGTVVFEPGQTETMIATSIVDDDKAEDEESFAFFVSGDPAAVTIQQRRVEVRIADDDG